MKTIFLIFSVFFFTACSNLHFDQSLAQTAADLNQAQGLLVLNQTPAQSTSQHTKANQLLAQPLQMADAIQIALLNSPALQSSLAENWAQAARAAQTGRLPNPLLNLERISFVNELEIGRLLSIGLLDLLTWPQRKKVADQNLAISQLRLSQNVLAHLNQASLAWINAVTAQQQFSYMQQVNESAEASAELAKRMQQVGNFSKLQRARHHAFFADVAAQLARAQQNAHASREALIRALGLNSEQATILKLPNRLPDLPKIARDANAVSQAANQQRLDIRLAQAILNQNRVAQGLAAINSFTDIELGLRHNTVQDNGKQVRRGYELNLRLPIFDWGDLQRDAANADTLAAAHQLEAVTRAAGSHIREAYFSYRTQYDIAQHYQTEVLPLRQLIADENVLRYNGMLIGVFELLADAREQLSAVSAAITAQQQFWLAEVALQAAILGKPLGSKLAAIAAPNLSPASNAGH